MTTLPVKVCRKCGEPKPTSEFYEELKGAHKPEGKFRAVCKDCWNGQEPPVTDEERKDFVKQFVLDHLQQHGETNTLYFIHAINHRYPEITMQSVERVLFGLIQSKKVVAQKRLAGGDTFTFLRLPKGIA
jgi:hypothetical protein